MYSIDLSGKKGIVLGVANDRSIAWSIASILGQAGARLVIINNSETPLDDVADLVIRKSIGETLRAVLQNLNMQT